MSDEEHSDIEDGRATPADFFDHEPTKEEKIEMRRAVKPPSEWLKLLCKDWAGENEVLVETTDAKFLDYKPYLKGLLTSQLLCRLSIPPSKDSVDDSTAPSTLDFWDILGITDAFDRAYIVAQVERFCSLYSIRHGTLEDGEGLFGGDLPDPATLAAAAAAGLSVSVPLSYMDQSAAAAAAAAAAVASVEVPKLSRKQASVVSRARNAVKDAEKALEKERRQNMKKEQRRLTEERKEQKIRNREASAVKKATERAAREATREDRRQRKLEDRREREEYAQQQKNAALQRAAELVESNRVPIEITRGAEAAKAAAQAALSAGGVPMPLKPAPAAKAPKKRRRSAITVSTASDLHQIVTYAKNLWAKYNAIAQEHNQKVSWITVSKELGINVKVREKYARMHSRAEQRGFDWNKNGHWKIKDHPEIFMEPTQADRKARQPLPPRSKTSTVLLDGDGETADAVAAAAAVVDASVHSASVDSHHTEVQTAVAATLVADPTAGSYNESNDGTDVHFV